MGDDALGIHVNGVMLDRAGVIAALEDRAARIAGELDRVKFDCELPQLADTLAVWAREAREDVMTALRNRGAAPNVIPRLFSALDALIRDLAMVRTSNVADEGFPTHAQGRALLRLLRFIFGDEAQPGDRGAHVARGGGGSPESVVVVRMPDGSTGYIAPDGRLSA